MVAGGSVCLGKLYQHDILSKLEPIIYYVFFNSLNIREHIIIIWEVEVVSDYLTNIVSPKRKDLKKLYTNSWICEKTHKCWL